MLGVHKAIEISQASEYAKEMRKWESEHSRYGPPGRQRTFEEFPKRVYKADRVDGKGIVISESFTVNDADEQRNMESRGFHVGQQEALDAAKKLHITEYGKLSAERQWEIEHGRVSERAANEVRAAEAQFSGHMPVVPETPIKRRGRKPKAKAEPTTTES